MKKILWITQIFPSGASGTSVKTRATLQYLLRKNYHVDVCCVHDSKMIKNAFHHKNLRIFTVQSDIILHFSFKRKLKVIRKLFSFVPFRVQKLKVDQMVSIISALRKENTYDYVLFDGFATLQYAEQYDSKNIYIEDEDISDLVYQRMQMTNNFLLKSFYFVEFQKCQLYERKFFPYMNQIWAISEKTLARLQARVHKIPVFLMPTIVSHHKNRYRTSSSAIVFSGLLSWPENVHGLQWFLKNCWHDIQEAVPKTKMLITGQCVDPSLVRLVKTMKNVHLCGYVKELDSIYAKAALAISPILINCGIKVKIVTCLSYGLPVVSTPQATWGLSSLDGVIQATEADFAKKVVMVLKDEHQRTLLSKKAYANALRNHSEKSVELFFKRVKFFR